LKEAHAFLAIVLSASTPCPYSANTEPEWLPSYLSLNLSSLLVQTAKGCWSQYPKA
jgi:hypothetical protein